MTLLSQTRISQTREVEGLTVFRRVEPKSLSTIKVRTHVVVGMAAALVFRCVVQPESSMEKVFAMVCGVVLGSLTDNLYQALMNRRVRLIYNKKYCIKPMVSIFQNRKQKDLDLLLKRIFNEIIRTKFYGCWKECLLESKEIKVKDHVSQLNHLKDKLFTKGCIYGMAVVHFDFIKNVPKRTLKDIDLASIIEEVVFKQMNFIMLEEVRGFDRIIRFAKEKMKSESKDDELNGADFHQLRLSIQAAESEVYRSIFYSTQKSRHFTPEVSVEIYKKILEETIGSKISDVLSLKGVMAFSLGSPIDKDISYFDQEFDLLPGDGHPYTNYIVFQIQDEKFYFYDPLFLSVENDKSLFKCIPSGLYACKNEDDFFEGLHINANACSRAFSGCVNVVYFIDPSIETINNPSHFSS